MDMLSKFFKNDQNSINVNRLWEGNKWRFKKHAEQPFWRWVCSWARACRKPSDLGFDDSRFVLPELTEVEHIVRAKNKKPGVLFDLPAVGLWEQREERRRTINERCEKVAELTTGKDQSLVWCHLNKEGDLLEKLIPGAQQVSGSQPDHIKEERLMAFARGEIRVLVTKPQIGAWGLNLQRCAHITFFPSHSYEQYYQGVRRCWRFGQSRPVTVDVVSTDGGHNVMQNLQRKARAADKMFDSLVLHMAEARSMDNVLSFNTQTEVPSWLSQTSS